MVQLESITPSLSEEGIALYAISYDSREVLEKFSHRHGITFPLLSDVGSHVIRRVGVANHLVHQDHEATAVQYDSKYEGVPFPSTFLVDERGRVADRRFHRDYRVRDTGSGLISRLLDITLPPASENKLTAKVLTVRVSFESDRYEPFQILWLRFHLEILPRWHIYGSPIPDGLAALEIQIDEATDLLVGEASLPEPVLRLVAGFNDPLPVYEGALTGLMPVTFATDQNRRFEVNGWIRFQACTRSECLPPQTLLWSREVNARDS